MKFLTLLMIFFINAASAQDLAAFNAIYTKTFLETSQKDFGKALRIADSLYTVSETPVLQTKSLMLTATLYQQIGDFEKGINYALQSQKIIETTDNAIWKARVYGFLATGYRFVRLFDHSKKYFEMAVASTKEITNEAVANNTMAMMMQEMAYYDIEKKNYRRAIKDIEKSEEYVEKTTSSNKLFLTINNQQLLGYNYYYIQDYEESFKQYQKALALSAGIPENYLVGLIHNGLALLYLEKKDMINAKKHLDIALRITEESKNPSLKNEVYGTSEKYHAITNNLKDYLKVKIKHDTVMKNLEDSKEIFVNKSFTKIDKENIVIKEDNSAKNIIIIVITLLFIIGIILFIRYRNIQRSNIKNFKRIIKEFDVNHSIIIAQANPEIITDSEAPCQRLMSDETEQKILGFLKKFEDLKLYKDNNISLSSLATYCETNTKYLSNVINVHKNNDFNNYINTLRINYAIDKLRSNRTYRKYKLATLAEEAGFSSLNKFSLIFKKATMLTPSLFIKYLNEQDEQEGTAIADV